MKKFILFFLALLFLIPSAQAGECNKITDVNDYWVEVKSGVNIRDQVCDGNVIGSLTTGTKVKVTGEIEGWRYIQTPEGGVGFIWSDFVQNTTPPVAEEPQEPLYDIVGHKYEAAVRYLEENGIIQGYPDGSYQPERSVNRAEFTKIIVGAKLGSEPTDSAASCFPDVKSSDWFASYVCYAKDAGIIGGYPDSTFKPANNINLAEATKILVNTMAIDMSSDDSGDWFEVFIRSMQNQSYIPDSFANVSQLVNRSQMAEMVYRIMEEIHNKPAKSFVFVDAQSSGKTLVCADSGVPASVDMDEVRSTWFAWINGARNAEGLASYQPNAVLNATAGEWSDYQRNVGVMSHTRPGQTDFYDYSLITQWFEDLGVTFKNVGGWTYSENIGRTWLNCNDSNCTDELLDGLEEVFNMYMAEKGTSYTAHYDSVMSPNFTIMGIGFGVTGKDNYVTVHYAAELDQKPTLSCN